MGRPFEAVESLDELYVMHYGNRQRGYGLRLGCTDLTGIGYNRAKQDKHETYLLCNPENYQSPGNCTAEILALHMGVRLWCSVCSLVAT